MAATSEQMVLPNDQDLKRSITAAAPAPATKLTHNKTNSLSTSSIRSSASSKERRPSFSITLPSSCSRSSQLTNNSLVFNTLAGPDDDNDSTAGFEEALALQQQQESNEGGGGGNNHAAGLQSLDQPPVRRRSIQFIP
ncbi:hypothetical protein BGZ97_009567, partial [Linnemannia gamsii]